MTDPTGKVAETEDFGAARESAGGMAEARDTWQDEDPSTPPAAFEEGGTAHRPAQLDRPLPGDEPLSVRFATED